MRAAALVLLMANAPTAYGGVDCPDELWCEKSCYEGHCIEECYCLE